MDDFLIDLLEPLCKKRSPEDFIFVSEGGYTIDDRMFLRRVFKPIQKELKIRYRVVYALRHSFATRAVRQGMIPSQVAYLMGDTVETVLRNYFHNNMMPAQLPGGVPSIMQAIVLPKAS
jgi:integrase